MPDIISQIILMHERWQSTAHLDTNQPGYLDRVVEENKKRKKEITQALETCAQRAHLATVFIDHGYEPSRNGYCANGFYIETHGGIFIATASHNVGPVATVLLPTAAELQQTTLPFIPVGVDAAFSTRSFSEVEGLPLHYQPPQPGDVVGLFGKRHVGNGMFEPFPTGWGTYLGTYQHSLGVLHQATLEAGSPQLGDSGSAVVSFGQDSLEPHAAGVVGVLHGEGKYSKAKSFSFSGFYFE